MGRGLLLQGFFEGFSHGIGHDGMAFVVRVDAVSEELLLGLHDRVKVDDLALGFLGYLSDERVDFFFNAFLADAVFARFLGRDAEKAEDFDVWICFFELVDDVLVVVGELVLVSPVNHLAVIGAKTDEDDIWVGSEGIFVDLFFADGAIT